MTPDELVRLYPPLSPEEFERRYRSPRTEAPPSAELFREFLESLAGRDLVWFKKRAREHY
jgi:hypothetical protein